MTMPLRAARRSPAALLVPLGVGALVAIALGVYGKVHTPTGHALYTGPFPSMFAMKVWLTSVALVLALVQLFTALWMYGKLPWRSPRWLGAFHRGTGALAFIVTLPVAFHCLWALGFQDHDLRVLAHSLLGCLFYGAFATKVMIVRSRGLPGIVLPVAGGALFTVLIAAWLTSGLWFISENGFPSP